MYNTGMEFTCNEAKNEKNIQERGLPLLAARLMFTGSLMVYEDTRKAYPEKRFIGYNFIEARWMVVVFCYPHENQTHIISFRKANQREIKKLNAKKI